MIINMKEISDTQVLAGSVFGKKVFVRIIEKSIIDLTSPSPLLLNFCNVDLATASFLRETVFAVKSYMRLRRSTYYPVVANINDTIREELLILADAMNDAVISCNHSLEENYSNSMLIGNLEPKLQEVFDYITQAGSATAVRLRRCLGEGDSKSNSTVWNNRLSALVSRGVIKETSNGRLKIYKPIIEEKL